MFISVTKVGYGLACVGMLVLHICHLSANLWVIVTYYPSFRNILPAGPQGATYRPWPDTECPEISWASPGCPHYLPARPWDPKSPRPASPAPKLKLPLSGKSQGPYPASMPGRILMPPSQGASGIPSDCQGSIGPRLLPEGV